MNKQEKQIAAYYLAQCMNENRIANMAGNTVESKKAMDDFLAYSRKLREMLKMKSEMFGLDYAKSVDKPIREVMKMAGDMYSNIVNGQPAF